MKKLITILGFMLMSSTVLAAEETVAISKQTTKFQFVCETIGKNLPLDYQPKYNSADEYKDKDGAVRKIEQGCRIYSVGFDQAISFKILEAFNSACVSDNASYLELAPSMWNTNLRTGVLNLRCAPKN